MPTLGIGIPGTQAGVIRAGLYGIFENKHTHKSGADGPTPPDCPWAKEWQGRCPYFYELERVSGYESLERRLVVGWGKDGINWHKYLKNLPVLELLPDGRKLPVFEDYLEFRLSHQDLKELFAHPDAHRDWRSALESVAGVYLILAEKTGDMYVGSAYGAAGIWGRWEQYAKTGHGGNKYLIDLLNSDPDYPGRFWFSLLQILPKSFTMTEVIKREELYKRKLGTRAHELHLN